MLIFSSVITVFNFIKNIDPTRNNPNKLLKITTIADTVPELSKVAPTAVAIITIAVMKMIMYNHH
jgi:hypothetical protein